MIVNYYTLLNIDQSADLETIKKAFRREIAIYHPDNNKSPEAREKFEQLVEAFDILSNEDKRREYDQMLAFEANNKPVVLEQKQQYEDWQKEAKKKSKKYNSIELEDLLLLDIFVLNGDFLDGLLSGTDGIFDSLEDIFDLF
ncbi:DnaJ domain-containing protein [Winogradskyella tangerina]|uniref:DnaJ domain-containing protein n=1 Tax=Winogradskyella tangerina TaxID=2023240 RepID=UPI000DBE80A8|nr:DnaJ domain-containing protein [Winogradskyella tangerina]